MPFSELPTAYMLDERNLGRLAALIAEALREDPDREAEAVILDSLIAALRTN